MLANIQNDIVLKYKHNNGKYLTHLVGIHFNFFLIH